MAKKSEYKGITKNTRALINGQEGSAVDFKQESGSVSDKLLVAFANAAGGTVLVGVAEVEDDNGIQRGEIVGCDVSDDSKLLIANRAASCRPSIPVSIQIENTGSDNPILRVDVPEGADKPYATDSGRYLIRSEARNVPIDPPMMKAIILQAEADQFVDRFREASEEMIVALKEMEENLASQIQAVEVAAQQAQEAAIDAQDAARGASAAAEDAFTAAEEAAATGMDY